MFANSIFIRCKYISPERRNNEERDRIRCDHYFKNWG